MAERARGILRLTNHRVPGSITDAITTAERIMRTTLVNCQSAYAASTNTPILNRAVKLMFINLGSWLCPSCINNRITAFEFWHNLREHLCRAEGTLKGTLMQSRVVCLAGLVDLSKLSQTQIGLIPFYQIFNF